MAVSAGSPHKDTKCQNGGKSSDLLFSLACPFCYIYCWYLVLKRHREQGHRKKKIKHHSKIRWDSLPVGSCVAHLFCLTIWIPISATLCKLCRCQSSCRQSHRKLSSKLSSDGSIKGWQEKKKTFTQIVRSTKTRQSCNVTPAARILDHTHLWTGSSV